MHSSSVYRGGGRIGGGESILLGFLSQYKIIFRWDFIVLGNHAFLKTRHRFYSMDI